MNAESYFATARERESIRRKRLAGEPAPWTVDPIFRSYRFTNVHREHDKTTTWFREHVRSKLDGLAVVEAILIFRWFNSISTGEVVEDLLLNGWDTEEARRRLKDKRPVVTGAYMVHSPIGYSKLDGLLVAIDWARPKLPKMVERWGATQEQAHRDLCTLDNMGSFSAGEVVWDLRWTSLLENATDINSWTNAGPGCARGLGYVVADDPRRFNHGSKSNQREMLILMQELLVMSRSEDYWPTAWEPWELHEVEMWLCEYGKVRNAQRGERLKRRFQ